MDFRRIPFNSALDRLSHLSTIRLFMRLRTVVPRSKEVSQDVSHYDFVHIERTPTSFLSMTFTNGFKEDRVDFDSLEAVLNSGPVECTELTVKDVGEFPMEAITSTRLGIFQITPGILPFLACGASDISFSPLIAPQSAVSLTTIIAHLGNEVETLIVPHDAFSESADIDQIEPLQTGAVHFSDFCMIFSSAESMVEWARKNVHALAYNGFCKNAYLCCNPHQTGTPMDEQEMRSSMFPYCQHGSVEGGHDRFVCISYAMRLYKFYFNINFSCVQCSWG